MDPGPKVEWALVEELLNELSVDRTPYSNAWSARVMGIDERNVCRYKSDGCPNRVVETMLERVNRGVRYDKLNPPSAGEISKRHSKRYYIPEKVPFGVANPALVAKLGVDYDPKDAAKLLGIQPSTFYHWRRSAKPGGSFPVRVLMERLDVTREDLGLTGRRGGGSQTEREGS